MPNVVFSVLTAILFFPLCACSNGTTYSPPPVTPYITMTNTGTPMSIGMAGSGNATIDWGDGVPVPLTPPLTSTPQEYKCWTPGAVIRVEAEYGITELWFSNNDITSLDVSNNIALTELRCGWNNLASLDLSNNTALTYLSCVDNNLTSLDVSKNTTLTYLDCASNNLTSLDVSKNTALTNLRCSRNNLASLDVSKNTALTTVFCSSNQMDAPALNALFGTLHSNTGTKRIDCSWNPGSSTCDTSIATAKGWTVTVEN